MDHLSRSLLNTYADQPLDRSAHGRKDPAWLKAQADDPNAEYFVLSGHNVVTTAEQQPITLTQPQFLSLDLKEKPTLLGLKKSDGTPVFAINLADLDTTLATILNQSPESVSLRTLTRTLKPEIAAMLSYATLLNHWHLSTRFCTRCGTALEKKEGGYIQQCTHQDCGHIEFPRINPAVIMRVTRGNKILLARQANWPEFKYSVLAGFVEIGETLEHAVQREVMEEVRIPVDNIHYHSSQPWPFPNSLMLGYTAQASADEFELEQDDIEQALWLTAEEMQARMIEGTVLPPPDLSISYRLINDWFEAETGLSLNAFKASLPQHA